VEKFVNEDYHQPFDEIKSWWKFDGTVKHAQLYFITSLKIADDSQKPEWKKGSRFYEIGKNHYWEKK
jgi:hypothetical protein